MAVVQGVKERLHLPIFDSLTVESKKQLREAEPTSILKFFVDVQRKTKLETNLQSAGLLPHYNTFEARALRVVFSDLPPEFSDEQVEITGLDVLTDDDKSIDSEGRVEGAASYDAAKVVSADVKIQLWRFMELLKEARQETERSVELDTNGEEEDVVDVSLVAEDDSVVNEDAVDKVWGGTVSLAVSVLEEAVTSGLAEKSRPPPAQVTPNDGAGSIISKFIYNTVTSLFVGEKLMISMPTWFFPSGAGPYSEGARFTTNGEPNPTATFRFAEPIFIDKQQNFRVEIEVPDSDVLKEVQRIYGPMFIWVVLDGYMTRDVQ